MKRVERKTILVQDWINMNLQRILIRNNNNLYSLTLNGPMTSTHFCYAHERNNIDDF